MSKIMHPMNKMELDTPCLVIEKSALEFNLNIMRQHSHNTKVNIRPHVKTHKCSKLAKLQIEYGAIGISTAKVSEAEALIHSGINNILITSPVDLVPCFNKEKANCCIAPICKLKGILHEAQSAFMSVLDRYTLADVLHKPKELSVLLNIR